MKNLIASFRRPLQNSKGIAILIAVACLLIITYVAIEVSEDTLVEYRVNANGLNRVKAYYVAKAGMDIALLRIKVYQHIKAQFGSQLGSNAGIIDEIWKFPFSWPLPVSEEVNAVDRDSIQKLTQGSLMDATFLITIEDEGSKIDINDLNSPSKSLRDTTRALLLGIFAQKMQTDTEFQRKYSSYRFDELINAIEGWQIATSRTEDGQDKRSFFRELNTRAGNDYFPPNRAFRTVSELRMIPAMNEDFFRLLEPVVTVYGMKGINPNVASKAVLQSLDTGINEEVADEIIKRRGDTALGGPFKDAQDFWDFATSRGARLAGDTEKIPLIFDSVTNFRIKSTGEFAGVVSEIEAVVMDLDRIAATVKDRASKEQNQNQSQADPTAGGAKPPANASSGSGSSSNNKPLGKGPPRIVYWHEK